MAKIGIFDSGYGGLTILDAIRKRLPQYDYIYLGDNARAPYGTHSFDVIHRYTLQAVQYLLAHECALVILACNTASAKALRTIQQKDLVSAAGGGKRKTNVLGVIRPTVEAVPELTRNGHVGILATPATVSSESYVIELEKIAGSRKSENETLCPTIRVTQQACPMWVPLIESGEHTKAGADYFVEEYLKEIFAKDPEIDTLVLGCTHYPLLAEKISRHLSSLCPHPVRIVAQGHFVSESLADYLHRHPEYSGQLSEGGSCRYLTTENADRFSQSASLFLASPISAEHVEL